MLRTVGMIVYQISPCPLFAPATPLQLDDTNAVWFADDDTMSDRELQDYQSIYIETWRKIREQQRHEAADIVSCDAASNTVNAIFLIIVVLLVFYELLHKHYKITKKY